MAERAYHIAQINIGRMAAPLDSPIMAEFMNNLDRINALAESSPGFIWRLIGDGNNATSLRPFDDDMIIVNMSVWKTVEDLQQYVYHSAHAGFIRKRKEWFSRMNQAFMGLWWIPAGHIPTVDEAKEHLEHLRAHGESEYTFTFLKTFPPPT
jgi:Domain of unknown function (DUF3291)